MKCESNDTWKKNKNRKQRSDCNLCSLSDAGGYFSAQLSIFKMVKNNYLAEMLIT